MQTWPLRLRTCQRSQDEALTWRWNVVTKPWSASEGLGARDIPWYSRGRGCATVERARLFVDYGEQSVYDVFYVFGISFLETI